jgi:hypothetical protein
MKGGDMMDETTIISMFNSHEKNETEHSRFLIARLDELTKTQDEANQLRKETNKLLESILSSMNQ